VSVLRLILMDAKTARAGLIPSRALSTVLLALSRGAANTDQLWKLVEEFDPTLADHFHQSEDKKPVLEGAGDGLLVINWEHHCLESFQEFEPVTGFGEAIRHNGLFSEDEKIPFQIDSRWHIVDHNFEERF
jgi:hypothetical protein